MSRKNYSASVQQIRNISSAISKEQSDNAIHLAQSENDHKIDWHEQRKLLRKKQVIGCEVE